MRHRLAVEQLPAGRLELAADQAQQRGFAATGTTHDGHHLAARNLHVDPFQHRPPS
jgi:hypothetical protein